MNSQQTLQLSEMVLAPYIQKATALIGQRRKIGGNQFRHQIACFGICLDYALLNPVLLKASIIHDLFEDIPGMSEDNVVGIDNDGSQVAKLVREVTKHSKESKETYLARLLASGSTAAKLLKCADRISNLMDLNRDVFESREMQAYLNQTEEFILPMAHEVNQYMEVELSDLIKIRRIIIEGAKTLIP